MSIDFSLCLLVPRVAVERGLSSLQKYSPNDKSYSFNTWPRKKEVTLKTLQNRLNKDENILNSDEVFRLNIVYRGEKASLWTTEEMQTIFRATMDDNFLLFNLELYLNKNQDFVSTSHPLLSLITTLAAEFNTIYGWMEADFVGMPDEYGVWYPRYASPDSMAPWHILSSTQILGKPLSRIVKDKLDLISDYSGLFYVKEIGDDLFFVTQPGDPETRAGYQNNEVYRRHFKAAEKLWEVLKAVPQSVLNS